MCPHSRPLKVAEKPETINRTTWRTSDNRCSSLLGQRPQTLSRQHRQWRTTKNLWRRQLYGNTAQNLRNWKRCRTRATSTSDSRTQLTTHQSRRQLLISSAGTADTSVEFHVGWKQRDHTDVDSHAFQPSEPVKSILCQSVQSPQRTQCS